MLILDTDHFSEWQRASDAGNRLQVRLRTAGQEMSLTVITVEEQLRGWLAEINNHRDPRRQISAYEKLHRQINVFAQWIILPWNSESFDLFQVMRQRGVRIGTPDLRIACIALVNDALLLTRNATDFAKVPGLRSENWLD